MTLKQRSWLSRLFKRRYGVGPRHRQSRRLLQEALEQRQLLAADLHGDGIATAYAVSLTPGGTAQLSGTIGDGDYYDADVDLFDLGYLEAGQTLVADINAYEAGPFSSLDSYLRLFDINGSEVWYNDYGPTDSYDALLSFTITTTDVYYLGVSSYGNEYYNPSYEGSAYSGYSTGDYDLELTVQGSAPQNTAPIAVGESFTIEENTVLNVASPGVLANDSDNEGDPLTANFFYDAAYGSITNVGPDGSFTYTPDTDFVGIDYFTYSVMDPAGASSNATVTVTVTPSNQPPVAVADSFEVVQGSSLTVIAAGVLGNDSDPEAGSITAVLQSGPAHGTLSPGLASDGSFTYTPNPGYVGSDSFTYVVNDGELNSLAATVSISVTTNANSNQIPVAHDDVFRIDADATLVVAAPGLLGNDMDSDGGTLSAQLVAGPQNGAITYLDTDGSFEYVPNSGFQGKDTFTYRVHDGADDSQEATVTLFVGEAAFFEPQAKNDRYATYGEETLHVTVPGVLANDTEADRQDVSIQLLKRPRFGTLDLLDDGSFTYEPFPAFSGMDSFRYQVINAAGISNPVTVELEVIESQPTVLSIADKPHIIGVTTASDGYLTGYMSLREALDVAASNGKTNNVIDLGNLPPDAPIRLLDSLGPLTISTDVKIRGPVGGLQEITTLGATGLLHIEAGRTVELENLLLTGGNLQGGDGAGIWNAGNLTVERSHITGNQVTTVAANGGSGAGIYNVSGANLTVIDSTISGNDAEQDGGGIFNESGAVLQVLSSTVSGNTAGLWGGGIYNAGTASVLASTVALNEASTGANVATTGSLNLSNTIAAQGIGASDIEGTVNSLGGNLVGNGDAASPFDASDLVGTTGAEIDPLLGTLQDNGGPTPTHMLLTGSPAIDAGTKLHRFRDQRGGDRMLDGLDADDLLDTSERVDIGAIEFGTFFTNTFDDAVDLTPLGDGRVDVDASTPGDQVSLRGAIQELNALAGHGNTAGLGSGQLEGAIEFDELAYHTFLLDIRGADEDLAAQGDLDIYGKLSIHGDLESYDRPLTIISGGWQDGLRYNMLQLEMVALQDRIFHVQPDATLDLTSLKVGGGQADYEYGGGGAILNEQGTVFLSDVDVELNVAQYGGGIATLDGMTIVSGGSSASFNIGANGGGFYLDGGLLNIDGSTVWDNTVTLGGAAVYLEDGELQITNDSLLRDNEVYTEYLDPQGSALFIAGGVANLSDGAELRGNGFVVADNYESDYLVEEHLLPDAAHVHSDSSIYSGSSVVFVTEAGELNINDSMIHDSAVHATIAVINLGKVYSSNSIYEDNMLALVNFRTGEAVVEGGILRDNGGHYDFAFSDYAYNLATFDYANGYIVDSPVQNHNGQLTLLGTWVENDNLNSFARDIANFGSDAQFNIIGTTLNEGSIYNRGGNMHIADSLIFGDYQDWYDGYAYATVQHMGHGTFLTDISDVPDLVLDADLEDYQHEVMVVDATPITRYQLPYPVVIEEERMIVTGVDLASNTLTVSRPHPQDHARLSKVILRNEFATQIAVEDLDMASIHALPLDIYLATSTSLPTNQGPWITSAQGGWASEATQVEALTVTDIDYENGILHVLRGRNGTSPARFNQAGASQSIWSMPGQLTISGTTFTNNSADIFNLDAVDRSVAVVRSSVAELAPPLIIENSTFSKNISNGSIANVFAERNSLLGSVVTYQTQNYEIILIDGAEESFVVESISKDLAPAIIENTVFSGSTHFNTGASLADQSELSPSGRYTNFIEQMTREDVYAAYSDLLPGEEETQPETVTLPEVPLDVDLENRPKRITLDDGSQAQFLAPATTLTDGYLDDGWLLHFDETLPRQAVAEWSYFGAEPATYSISTIFREESAGTIAFRVNNVEQQLHLSTSLTQSISTDDLNLTMERIDVRPGEHLRIGSEELLILSVVDNGDATQTISVQRGTWGTSPAAHNAGQRVTRSDLLYFDEVTNREWVTILEDYEFGSQATDYEVDGKIEVEIWPGSPASAVVADAVQIREKVFVAPGQSTPSVVVTADNIGTLPDGAHLDLGVTAVGTSLSQEFQVRNDSAETYFIPPIQVPQGFSISDNGLVEQKIDPGETRAYTLTLDADAPYQAHGPVVIEYDVNRAIEFWISGVSLLQNAVQIGDDGDSRFTASGPRHNSTLGYLETSTFAGANEDPFLGLWEWDVEPGTYRISTTWIPKFGNAANTPFTLYDEVDVLLPVFGVPTPSVPGPASSVSLIDASSHDVADLALAPNETTSLGNRQPFQNALNLALGVSVVASNSDDTTPDLHQTGFLTDGNYGNGASFRALNQDVQLTLDLGSLQSVDTLTFGRDRTGAYNDHQVGGFTISVSDDDISYTQVFDSAVTLDGSVSYGSLPAGHTLRARFPTTQARYVRLAVSSGSAAEPVVIDEIEIFAPDTTSPTVTAVILGAGDETIYGDGWTPEFRDEVDGLGSGAGNGLGYDILAGGGTIPWDNIDRIYVQFSEDVGNVTASDIALLGSATDYASASAVSYDANTHRATIELSSPLVQDKLRLAINYELTDEAGNVFDGDASGTPGGAFDFRFDVMPGDADGDGSVTFSDLALRDAAMYTYVSDAGYDPRADWNADDSIDDIDDDVFYTYLGESLDNVVEPRELDPDPPTPDANDILLGQYSVNQSLAPANLVEDGQRWAYLGQHTISTDLHQDGSTTAATLLVEMSNQVTSGNAVADALRLQRVADITVMESGVSIEHDTHIGFGITRPGTSVEKTFTVSNTGSESYALRQVLPPGGFSVVHNFVDGQILAPGQSVDLTLRLDAARPMKSYGTVALVMDDVGDGDVTEADHLFRFSISGTALDATETVQFIDNADPGAEQIGSFEMIQDGYREGMWVSNASFIGNRAFWIVDIEPGTYQVSATWAGLDSNSTAAPFTVYDGVHGALLGATVVDQTQLGMGATRYGNSGGRVLGTYTATGNTLLVEVTDSGSNPFVADAIRVQRVVDLNAVDEQGEPLESHVGFGIHELEAEVERTFTFTNDSSSTYTLRPVLPPEGFWIPNNFVAGQTLAPGESVDLTFQLKTDRVNKAFGEVVLVIDDGQTIETTWGFSISGTVAHETDAPQIVDNLDDGFDWAGQFTAAANDVGYDDSMLLSNSDEEASGAWWIVDVEPGAYDISTTWALEGHATDATFTLIDGGDENNSVSYTVNQGGALQDPDNSATEWNNIGSITASGNYLIVSVSNDVSGGKDVVADAIRISGVTDDQPNPLADKYSSDYFSLQYARNGIAPSIEEIVANSARWEFEDVAPGKYGVLINWPQTYNPGGQAPVFFDSFEHHDWYVFERVDVSTDKVTVQIDNPTYTGGSPEAMLVSADEIRLIEHSLWGRSPGEASIATSQSRQIIDNAQPGYSTTTAVDPSAEPASYAGTHDALPDGVTATYHFSDLVPGTYLVAASFDHESDSTKPFTIRDAQQTLSAGQLDYSAEYQSLERSHTSRQIAAITERISMEDDSILTRTVLGEGMGQDVFENAFHDDGYRQDGTTGHDDRRYDWLVLDRVRITGNELIVELAGGLHVSADAIRIERFDDSAANLGALENHGGRALSHAPQKGSAVIDHATGSLFKGLNTEVVRPVDNTYTDGWIYVEDVTPFVRNEHNLDAPFFPFPIEVGRERMLAIGYDLNHSVLIVERGYDGTDPLTHDPGTKILYGFAGRSTQLLQTIDDPNATTLIVENIVGLPHTLSATRQFDIRLGSEEMTVTDVVDPNDGTLLLTVMRGVRGTPIESVLPADTHVLVLADQGGGHRIFNGDQSANRRMDFGAEEAVYIDVTSTTDLVDSVPGDGYAATSVTGAVALRGAIQEANAIGGRATILLPAGHYDLTLADSGGADEFGGDLDINSDITIVGAGVDQTTIDASGLDRIFEVYPGATLSLQAMTLTGGSTSGDGGAILVRGGRVSLTEMHLVSNTAADGGAIAVQEEGAAILYRSTLSGNTATGHGGGLDVASGTLEIRDATISGNTATTGAGLFVDTAGTANVASSTIVENHATENIGGIHSPGIVILSESVVALNTSDAVGDVPDVRGRFESGGYNFVGVGQVRQTAAYDSEYIGYTGKFSITVTDATDLPEAPFSIRVEDIPDVYEDGEEQSEDPDYVYEDTVHRVTRVSGNTLHIDSNQSSRPFFAVDVGASIRFDGLWEDTDNVGTVAEPLDPQLGPLTISAGSMPTHEPLVGSPLIEAGPRPEGTTYPVDQRGEDRYFDYDLDSVMRRDLGAVEKANWINLESRAVVKLETDWDDVQSAVQAQPFEFLVTRSHADTEATVYYSVLGAGPFSANPEDFVGGEYPSGEVLFAAGQLEATIVVHVAGEDIVEANQRFTVNLDHASPSTILRNRQADGIIVNDDTVQVSVAPSSALEMSRWDLDLDDDGLINDQEIGADPNAPLDTDADGIPDYLDADSDNDGIADIVEAWDTDGDGIADTVRSGNDSDGDGLDDGFDADPTSITPAASNASNPPDTDGDGTPNHLDVDSDGDGILDLDQAWDTDGDLVADTQPSNMDSDGDGMDDAFDLDEDTYDTDGDYVSTTTNSTHTILEFVVTSNNDVEGGFSVDYLTEMLEEDDVTLPFGSATYRQDFPFEIGNIQFVGVKDEEHIVEIAIPRDRIVELDEQFKFLLVSMNDTTGTQVQASTLGQATGTILNDDVFGIETIEEEITTAPDGSSLITVTLALTSDVDEMVTFDLAAGGDPVPMSFGGFRGERVAMSFPGSGPVTISNVQALGREAFYDPTHTLETGPDYNAGIAITYHPSGGPDPGDGGSGGTTGGGGGDPNGGSGEGEDPYSGGGSGGSDQPEVTVWGSDFQWDFTLPDVAPRPLEYNEVWPEDFKGGDDWVFSGVYTYEIAQMKMLQARIDAMLPIMDRMIVATANDDHLHLSEPFYNMASEVGTMWGEVLSLHYMIQYDSPRWAHYPQQPEDDNNGGGGSDPGEPLPPDPVAHPDIDEDVFEVTTDTGWISHESQAFSEEPNAPVTGFANGIAVEDYEVSHTGQLTFNPIASYTIPESVTLTSSPDIQLLVSNTQLDSPDSLILTDLGSVVANDDMTITYYPNANVAQELIPRQNLAGQVYRYDKLDTFYASIVVQSESGPEIVAETEVKVRVTDTLPILVGDRHHNPDTQSAKLHLAEPIYVGFDSTTRVNIADLLFDPDGDPITVRSVDVTANRDETVTKTGLYSIPIGAIERSEDHQTPNTLNAGVINDFGSITHHDQARTWQETDRKHLFVKMVDPSLVVEGEPNQLYNGSIIDFQSNLTLGDTNSSMSSHQRWNPNAFGDRFTVDLVVTDGLRTDANSKEIARVLQLDIDPRQGAERGDWPVAAQRTRSFDKTVSPGLLSHHTSGVNTNWQIEAYSLDQNRSVESVGGTAVDLAGGTFLLNHSLILDQSGGASELAIPGLVYDSSTVLDTNAHTPIIQAQITKPQDAPDPTHVKATLTWYDHVSLDDQAGDYGRELKTDPITFTFPADFDWDTQPAAIALAAPEAPVYSGVYSWKLEVELGGATPITMAAHGQTPVVVNQSVTPDKFKEQSPFRWDERAIFGAGWQLAGVPTLTLDRFEGDIGDVFHNPDGADDRVMISFPGAEPILFNYSDLTEWDTGTFPENLRALRSGAKTGGDYALADTREYGTLTARHDPFGYDHPEDTDPDKPDELVYKAPDGTEYVFYRWEIKPNSGEDAVTRYLLNRIEQPGIDFDPDVTLSGNATSRRGVSFERNESADDYGRLEAIIASDGGRTNFSYDNAGYVNELVFIAGGPAGNRTIDLDIGAGGSLERITHVNAAPQDLTIDAPNRVRKFSYAGTQLTKDEWLDTSNQPVRTTEFGYGHHGLPHKTGLSQIDYGAGTIVYDVIPGVLASLQRTRNSDGSAAIADPDPKITKIVPLMGETRVTPGYEKYGDANPLTEKSITTNTYHIDGLMEQTREWFADNATSASEAGVLSTHKFTYNAVGDLSSTTDVNSDFTTVFRYDYDVPVTYHQTDDLLNPSAPASDPSGDDSRWEYDGDDYRGNVTHITTPLLTTINEYETDDETLDAVGTLMVEQTVYNKPILADFPDIVEPYLRTEYTRQNDGRITKLQSIRNGKDTGADGEIKDYIEVWSYYGSDGKGQLHKHTDARGLVTEYTAYDNTKPKDVTATNTYENTSIVDLTVHEYDAFGYQDTTKRHVDGNLFQTIDHDYDVAGFVRRIRTADAQSNVTAENLFAYATDGLVVESVEAQKTDAYAYHKGGNTPADAELVTNKKSFDKAGLLSKMEQAVAETYYSVYAGQQVDITQTTSYSYYSDGSISQTSLPDGTDSISYLDPVARTTWSSRTGVSDSGTLTETQTIETKFDSRGRVISTQNLLTGVNKTYSFVTPLHLETNASAGAIDVQSIAHFDVLGNQILQVEPGSAPTAFEYDEFGFQIAVTVPQVEVSGQPGVVDPRTGEDRIRRKFQPTGEVAETLETRFTPEDAGGSVTWSSESFTNEFKYDMRGRLRKHIDPLTDGEGTDEAGATPQVITYAFDTDLGLQQVTTDQRDGATTTEWYDALGRLKRQQNGLGGTWEYVHDNSGNLIREKFYFDYSGQVDSGNPITSDRDTEYRYDQLGRRRATIRHAGTESEFDAIDHFLPRDMAVSDGWETILFTALPGSTATLDTSDDDPVNAPDALAKYRSHRSVSDSLGNVYLSQVPDPNDGTGNTPTIITTYNYRPGAGQRISTNRLTPANNIVGAAGPTTTYAVGAPSSTFTAGETRVTRIAESPLVGTTDSLVKLEFLEEEDGIAASEDFKVGFVLRGTNQFKASTGQLEKYTSATGVVTTMQYDAVTVLPISRTQVVPGGASATSHSIYDTAGNLIVHDSGSLDASNQTTRTLDALGRIKEEKANVALALIDGNIVTDDVTRTWDYQGPKTVYTDRNGTITTTTVEFDNRKITEVAGQGGCRYLVCGVVDTTTYLNSDGSKAKIDQKYTHGSTWNSSSIVFEYDDLGRAKSTSEANFVFSGESAAAWKFENDYTLNGQTTTLSLAALSAPNEQEIPNASLTYTPAIIDKFEYDGLRRPYQMAREYAAASTSRWAGNTLPQAHLIDYEYVTDGQLWHAVRKQSNYNDIRAISNSLLAISESFYQYDSEGRALSLKHQVGTATPFAQYDAGYHPTGQLSSISTYFRGGANFQDDLLTDHRNFDVNALGDIDSSTDSLGNDTDLNLSQTHDALGNREDSTSGTVLGPDNRLLKQHVRVPDPSSNGGHLTKTRFYQYNKEGAQIIRETDPEWLTGILWNITTLVTPWSPLDALDNLLSFSDVISVYDPLGRLVQQHEKMPIGVTRTTLFAYDGVGNLVATKSGQLSVEASIADSALTFTQGGDITHVVGGAEEPVALTNESGKIIAAYWRDPNGRLLTSDLAPNGTQLVNTFWAHSTIDGTVSTWLHDSGTEWQWLRRVYDSFGNLSKTYENTLPAGYGDELPRVWAGLTYDQDANGYRTDSRIVDPIIGRFTSQDTTIGSASYTAGVSELFSGDIEADPTFGPTGHGMLQIAGGVLQLSLAGAAVVGSGGTLTIGAIFVAGIAIDNIYAGAKTAYAQEYHETITYELTLKATGSRVAARTVDIAAGFATPGGVAKVVGLPGKLMRSGAAVTKLGKVVDASSNAAQVAKSASVSKAVSTATGNIDVLANAGRLKPKVYLPVIQNVENVGNGGCFVAGTPVYVLDDRSQHLALAIYDGTTDGDEQWSRSIGTIAAVVGLSALTVSELAAGRQRLRKKAAPKTDAKDSIDGWFGALDKPWQDLVDCVCSDHELPGTDPESTDEDLAAVLALARLG